MHSKKSSLAGVNQPGNLKLGEEITAWDGGFLEEDKAGNGCFNHSSWFESKCGRGFNSKI